MKLELSAYFKRGRGQTRSETRSGGNSVGETKVAGGETKVAGTEYAIEYSMYRLSGQRLVIRAYINEVKVTPEMARAIKIGHFGKWAGHTHPPGWSHYPSDVDRAWLPIGQEMSVIYHDGGMTAFFRMLAQDEQFLLGA